MSYRIFISPQVDACSANRYINYFFETLSKKAIVVNEGSKKVSRSLDMFKAVFKCDVMILHWAEDVITLRFGYLQALVSIFAVLLFKLKGGRVVWFCHNRASHFKTRQWAGRYLRRFFEHMASNVVVHSTDGLTEMRYSQKTVYLPHPVYPENHSVEHDPSMPAIDILIWGNIFPYKGLDTFIDAYKVYDQTASVLIAGKGEAGYVAMLRKRAEGTNILIEDKFLNDEDLAKYFNQTRCIVLPYLPTDTFCSGALIHSLNANKILIGPSLGNFRDLNYIDACLLYTDYEDLFNTLGSLLNDPDLYETQLERSRKGIAAYSETNTWDVFIEDLLQVIGNRPLRRRVLVPKAFRRKKREKKEAVPAT
jgi:glycosyltransferase involved in cell wall biosynthesis